MKSKKTESLLFSIAFVLILLLGLWLRVNNIDQRPMHGDEANQAHRFEVLLQTQQFIYEPVDYHGPTLYFLTLPFAWFIGLEHFEISTKTFFRSVPVFFSMLTGLGTLLFINILGKRGVLAFALFIMISPAMVYYSTYYIQETLLVCFSLFAIGTLWRYFKKPKLRWSIEFGLSLGLMQATKETFILTSFAVCLTLFFAKLSFKNHTFHSDFKRDLLIALGSALFTSVLFYSSFFTHAQGPLDSVTSFSHQIKRGLGKSEFEERFTSGIRHSKPSSYYAETIIGNFPKKLSSTIKSIYRNSPDRSITEVIFFILPFIGLFYLKQQSNPQRIIYIMGLIYSLSLMVIYSLIPYKTPWCMLSFLLGFMFVSVLSFNFILDSWNKTISKVLLCLICLFSIDLFRQANLINDEVFCVTDKNPYAYVQPYFDVESLAERIHNISDIDGRKENMPIHFLTNEYWPMPWYLKNFNKIGYWELKEPELNYAQLPVVITTPDREHLVAKLEQTHTSEYRGRLPGYHFLVFYKNDLWNQFHETH